MTDLPHLLTLFATFMFPVFGGYTLLATKLSSGETKRNAERQFFVALILVTIVTLRTVVTCDDAWLIHTLTLASMVVGALTLPSYETSMAL